MSALPFEIRPIDKASQPFEDDLKSDAPYETALRYFDDTHADYITDLQNATKKPFSKDRVAARSIKISSLLLGNSFSHLTTMVHAESLSQDETLQSLSMILGHERRMRLLAYNMLQPDQHDLTESDPDFVFGELAHMWKGKEAAEFMDDLHTSYRKEIVRLGIEAVTAYRERETAKDQEQSLFDNLQAEIEQDIQRRNDGPIKRVGRKAMDAVAHVKKVASGYNFPARYAVDGVFTKLKNSRR